MFSQLISAVSSLSFFSSYFVFVIDEEFEEAPRKPTERTNNLPHIVECSEGGEGAINAHIDDYSGSWWKCSASLLI